MQPRQLSFDFPLLGLAEAGSYRAQKKGSTPRCSNVMPFDVTGRARGGQRPGLSTFLTSPVPGQPVNALLQASLPSTAESVQVQDSYTAPSAGNDISLSSAWHVSYADWSQTESGINTTERANKLFASFISQPYLFENDTTVPGFSNPRISVAKYQADPFPAGVGRYEVQAYWQPRTANPVNQGLFRLYMRLNPADFTDTADVVYAEFEITGGAPSTGLTGPAAEYSTCTIRLVVGGVVVMENSSGVQVGPNYWNYPRLVVIEKAGGVSDVYLYMDRSGFGTMAFVWATDIATSANRGVAWGMRDDTSQGATTGTPGSAFATSGYFGFFRVFHYIADVNARETFIVAAVGTSLYVGNKDGLALATGGSAVLTGKSRPCMAELAGKVYVVDGTNTLAVDLKTATVSALVATGGKGTVPAGCSIVTVWRGRLGLARQGGGFEQNFYFARINDPLDWDFAQDDAAAAFGGNASVAGKIGEPIISLAPFNDDALLIFGDGSIYRMTGDPADGGSIDNVSQEIGILGRDAWCQDGGSSIYFVSTGGLYVMPADGGAPQNLSNNLTPNRWKSIDRNKVKITCVHDEDRHAVWIFHYDQSAGAEGLTPQPFTVFDKRTGGIFPMIFGDGSNPTYMEPICGIAYDGDLSTDRAVVIGTRLGAVYRLDDAAQADDTSTIISSVQLGPVLPAGDLRKAIVQSIDFSTGGTAGTFNMAWSLAAGGTAEEAVEAPTVTATGTITTGRHRTRTRTRLREAAHVLTLSNAEPSTTWSLERVVIQYADGGEVR
jgi:hypothetical protein